MTDSPRGNPEPVIVETYGKFAAELRRFLYGLLKDNGLAEDVVQIAFARFVERFADIQEESRKAWLFRVAYNEAMLIRRKQQIHQRAAEQWSELAGGRREVETDGLVERETIEALRDEVNRLPDAQREVLYKRIYEGKTFACIAEELNAPLSTVLSRMQSALKRLRTRLDDKP